MPYLDGIYRVKKTVTPEVVAPEARIKKERKVFNWKKLLIVSAVIIFLVLSGFTTAFAYPKIKNGVEVLNGLGNGKYLVLFQNNNELRPSGGFIGSFAIVETVGGRIKNIDFETNIHKFDDPYQKTNVVAPPKGLDQLVGYWVMEDGGWAVDFSESAQKIAWFYQKQGGQETLDGVIAIDSTFFEEILNIIGPVSMPENGLTVTKENFFPEIQYMVEKAYFTDVRNWSINEPKTILKDLMQKVFEKMQDKKFYLPLTKLVFNSLERKHLLVYSFNPETQKYLVEKNWAGTVLKNPTSDYLYINQANVIANKSSLDVREEVRLTNDFNVSRVVNNLRIIRVHEGAGEWPSGPNKNYTRILVPIGSAIMEAKVDGVDYLDKVETLFEADKTVFAFTSELKPQSSQIIEIKYNLPATVSKKDYFLYWQKQPGTLGNDLEIISDNKLMYKGFVDQDTIVK